MMMFRGGPIRASFFHRRYPTNRDRRIRDSFTAAGFCFVCCEEMERATAVLTLAINFYVTKQTDQ
jgi:hypothetical protein